MYETYQLSQFFQDKTSYKIIQNIRIKELRLKKKEAFKELIKENNANELILEALSDRFDDEVDKMPPANLIHFLVQNEEGNFKDFYLTQFLNKNSDLFFTTQYLIIRWLMSFEFKFGLEDLNALFWDLESKTLRDIFTEELVDMKKEDVVGYLKHMIQRDLKKTDLDDETGNIRESKNNFNQSMMKRKYTITGSLKNITDNFTTESQEFSNINTQMQNFILKLMVLSFKFLRQKNALNRISKELSRHECINFNSNFWSEKLIMNLLYHYSTFEVRCKITEFLFSYSTVPFANYSFCEDEGSINEINSYVNFMLSEHIGIVSFSLEMANKRKTGKTELINDLLYTSFQKDSNDPFGNIRIEVDFCNGFNPSRNIAVMDCNFPDLVSFRAMSKMFNIGLLHVCYSDFVDNNKLISKQLMELKSYFEQHQIFLIIIIRDFNEYYLHKEEDTIKNKLIIEDSDTTESEEELQSDEEDDNKEEADDNDFCYYIEDNDTSKNQTQEVSFFFNELKSKKNKIGRKNVKKLEKKIKSDLVFIFKIKNLAKMNKNKKKENIEELQRHLNKCINQINEKKIKFKFNSEGFNNFRNYASDTKHSLVEKNYSEHNEDLKKIGNIPTQLSEDDRKVKKLKGKLDELVKCFDQYSPEKEDEFFPFNRLWRELDDLTNKLTESDLTEAKKEEAEMRIDEIERELENQSITDVITNFINIIFEEGEEEEPEIITLLSLFENYLLAHTKRAKKKNSNNSEEETKNNKNSNLFDINLFWRNIKPFLDYNRTDLDPKMRKFLINVMEELFVKGNGFELIDGDHFIFWGNLLNQFDCFIKQSDYITTMSILGPQSSGKSTLINLLYGTDFKSGDGKCTSGINGYLMRIEEDFESFKERIMKRIKKPNMILEESIKSQEESEHEDHSTNLNERESLLYSTYENLSIQRRSTLLEGFAKKQRTYFILFLDSQGMLSQEDRSENKDFDRIIGSLLLTISQIMLVNFEGDMTEAFANLLEVINYTVMNLNLGKKSLFPRSEPDSNNKEESMQRSFFISNKNKNLGNEEQIKKQKKSIRNTISIIEENLREAYRDEKKMIMPFSSQSSFIEVLKNAIKDLYKEKDDLIGLKTDINKTWIDPFFIQSLRTLKTNTIQEINAINTLLSPQIKERWSFTNFPNYLRKIWNQVYYNLEIFDMQSIRKEIIKKEYLRKINEEIYAYKSINFSNDYAMIKCEQEQETKAIEEQILEESEFVDPEVNDQILEIKDSKTNLELNENSEFEKIGSEISENAKKDLLSNKNILKSNEAESEETNLIDSKINKDTIEKNKKYKAIEQEIIEEKKENEINEYDFLDDPVNNNLEDVLKKIYQNYEKKSEEMEKSKKIFIEKKIETLKVWVDEKNKNSFDRVRKKLKYRQDDLMEIFKNMCKEFELFENVQKYNFIGEIKTRTIKKYLKFINSILLDGIGKEYNANSKENKIDYFKENFKEILEKHLYLIKSKLEDFLLKSDEDKYFYYPFLKKIFFGIFGNLMVSSDDSVWEKKEFNSKAIEKLEGLAGNFFKFSYQAVKRIDYEIDERLSEKEFLIFQKEQLQYNYKCHVVPSKKDEIVKNILNYLEQKLTNHKGKFDLFVKEINEILLELISSKIIIQFDDSILENIEKEFKTNGSTKNKLSNLKLILDKLNFDLEPFDDEYNLSYFGQNKFLYIPISRVVESINEIPKDKQFFRIVKNVSWSEIFFSQLSKNSENNYNLFFTPLQCKSNEKIKNILKTVLNSLKFQHLVVNRINDLFSKFVENNYNQEDPFEILKISSETVSKLDNEVVYPLLKALNYEAEFHGAEISFYFRNAIIEIVFQKMLILYKMKFESLFDQEINIDVKEKIEEIRESFVEIFIKSDIVKIEKEKYNQKFKSFESKIEQDNNTDIDRQIKYVKDKNLKLKNFSKIKWIENFEKKVFSENKYEEIVEYLFNQNKKLEEFNRTQKLDKFEEKLSEDLDKIIKKNINRLKKIISYLKELYQHLKNENLLNFTENDIVHKLNKYNYKEKICKKYFKYRFLKSIFETGHINKKYGYSNMKYSLLLNLKEKDKVKFKKNKLLNILFKTKFEIKDFKIFFPTIIEFFEKKLSTEDNVENKKNKIIETNLSQIKENIANKKTGCKKRCPLCFRMCELEKGHTGNHSLENTGHGMVLLLNQQKKDIPKDQNINESKKKNNPSKKKSKSLLDYLGQKDLPEFELRFCCDIKDKKEEFFNEKTKKVFRLQSIKDWKFGIKKNFKIRKYLKAFWSKHGDAYCDSRFLINKDKKLPLHFFIFDIDQRIGKTQQKYLFYPNEVIENFLPKMMKLNDKNDFTVIISHELKKGTKFRNYEYSYDKKNIEIVSKSKNYKKLKEYDVIEPEKHGLLYQKDYIEEKLKSEEYIPIFIFITESLNNISLKNIESNYLDTKLLSQKSFYTFLVKKAKKNEKDDKKTNDKLFRIKELFGKKFSTVDIKKFNSKHIIRSLIKKFKW